MSYSTFTTPTVCGCSGCSTNDICIDDGAGVFPPGFHPPSGWVQALEEHPSKEDHCPSPLYAASEYLSSGEVSNDEGSDGDAGASQASYVKLTSEELQDVSALLFHRELKFWKVRGM